VAGCWSWVGGDGGQSDSDGRDSLPGSSFLGIDGGARAGGIEKRKRAVVRRLGLT